MPFASFGSSNLKYLFSPTVISSGILTSAPKIKSPKSGMPSTYFKVPNGLTS